MLMKIVIVPDVFGYESFVGPNGKLLRQNAEEMFSGLLDNGVCLVDGSRAMLTDISDKINRLPIHRKQNLVKMLAESIKKKKFFRSNDVIYIAMSEEKKEACVKALANNFNVDAVAVACGDSSRWSAKLPEKVEVIGLDDYRDSEYEAARRRFSNISRTFDKMNEKELEDLFRRVFELVRNVRMYDPHIGTGNTRSFLNGIDYMLGIWSKYSRIREKKSLRIITAFKPHQKNYLIVSPQELNKTLADSIVNRLSNKYRDISINVDVKYDEKKIFRARYIWTDRGLYQLNKGLDIFVKGGAGNYLGIISGRDAAQDHIGILDDLPLYQ